MLLPVLHGTATNEEGVSIITQRLLDECRQELSAVYPFSKQEMNFLDGVNAKGKIVPSLITSEVELQARIARHPMLLWKAMNVSKHFEGNKN